MGVLEIAQVALTAVLTGAVGWLGRTLLAFMREQREANRANAMANRSMQRDVIYRYFRTVVEEGKHVTPEEFAHVEECYSAYHANGGNGAGTLMFEKIRENAVIDTGRG